MYADLLSVAGVASVGLVAVSSRALELTCLQEDSAEEKGWGRFCPFAVPPARLVFFKLVRGQCAPVTRSGVLVN